MELTAVVETPEETGLIPSPDRFVGGVRRLPTLARFGVAVVEAEVGCDPCPPEYDWNL